jgi:hypothetical protein
MIHRLIEITLTITPEPAMKEKKYNTVSSKYRWQSNLMKLKQHITAPLFRKYPSRLAYDQCEWKIKGILKCNNKRVPESKLEMRHETVRSDRITANA